jgi:RIO-like serine/threonine protein kinase
MVVMEYLEGSTAEQMYYKASPPLSVCEDVQAAITTLHRKGLVFEDLRRPKVLNKRAKLVDFDWCGRDGQDRYPTTLNTDIDWHKDVGRGMLMCKEHNLLLLKTLCPAKLANIQEE